MTAEDIYSMQHRAYAVGLTAVSTLVVIPWFFTGGCVVESVVLDSGVGSSKF